jgi:hypothetical protein
MTVEELHKLHMDRLIKSFGVSTAVGAFRNDRAARAFGNHYSDNGSHDTGRSEY